MGAGETDPDAARTYDDVVVPTDGSDPARVGAEQGLRLARALDATVHAVHAVDRSGALPGLELSGADRDRRAAGERAVEAVAARGEELGVAVETELLEGAPAAALLEYLAAGDPDLVAMGSRGRSNIERHLLGSVTERLVRASPAPVMTVREPAAAPADRAYSDLLLPTRGGDGAALAIEHAVGLAARVDATLHVLYAVDVRAQAANHDTYELGPLVDRLEAAVTDEVVTQAEAAGVDARAVVQQGTPHDAIQRYADDHGVDLVVMGTHGRGRVQRFLLGSIAERTVRTADVPVITVRLDRWFEADPDDPR